MAITKGSTEENNLDRKIISIVLIFVGLATSIVLISYFGSKITTGARAFVAGEGMWTKAQKKAVLHLTRYIYLKEEGEYNRFQEALQVNRGDKKARLTLLSEKPDYEKAYQGMLEGKNHPDDIPKMIWLLNNFQNISYIEEAIKIWTEGDQKIAELDSLANVIHGQIKNDQLTASQEREFINKIYHLDDELTELEQAFSTKMGQAARWANNTVFWVTLVIMLALILIACFVTVSTVQNIRSMNRKLESTQKKFRNVLNNSRDVIYQMDLERGEYVFMSAAVEDMIGYSQEEIIEKGPEFIVERMHPEDRKRMEKELENLKQDEFGGRSKSNTEFRVKTKDGRYVWVSNKRTFLFDEQGHPKGVVGSVRDISVRKTHEEEIDQSLKEKKVLLQEIHHRVKNNLAVINSLLELQKDKVNDEIKEIFSESQSRIQTIALVHEKLYQRDSLSDINIQEYIRELTDALQSAYQSSNQEVELKLDVDDVKLGIERAIPFGLILNELVNNAFKHAFKTNKEGVLRIGLTEDDGVLSLIVADNGEGLPKDFDIKNRASLGMTLINTLTLQIGGQVQISSNGWTEFEIQFE